MASEITKAGAIAGVLVDRFAALVPAQAEQWATTVERLAIISNLLPAAIFAGASVIALRYVSRASSRRQRSARTFLRRESVEVFDMAGDSGYAERSWARRRAKREFWVAVGRRLATWRILRVRSGHYYSPVPSIKELQRDAPRIFDRSFRSLPGIELDEANQLALLTEFATFYSEQPFSEAPRDDIRYFFDNYWYGRADAIFLYSMIRLVRPRRIIEIGSGFSSAVMLDTNERFMDRNIQFTFIEPDSTRLRKRLKEADYNFVAIVEQPIQHVDLGIVDQLAANDILFIDSSHVSKAGSDVNHIVFGLLPRLAPGVFVHFHDVLYPFEYPKEWFELGLSWNEAYILRAFLQYNPQFPIRFWNDFMMTFHSEAIQKLMPLCLHRRPFGVGGSLWLQKA